MDGRSGVCRRERFLPIDPPPDAAIGDDRTDMNVADIVILAVLLVSVLIGLMRGLVGEVLSLARWIAAFWIASVFGAQVGGIYGAWLNDPAERVVAGAITCFVGVLIVGGLITWAVRRLIKYSGLGLGDSFLGMAFGLARGLLLVTFVVLMLGFTPVPREAAWYRHSTLLPAFQNGAAWLAGALPAEFTHYMEAGGKSLPAVPRVPISTVEQAARQLVHPGAPSPSAASTTGHDVGHGPTHGDVGQ
jgi:membrane protein required for colicin V production